MKKLVLFAAVAFAASFAACSSQPATEEAATADTTCTELQKDANYAFDGDTLLLDNEAEQKLDTVVIAD